MNLREKVNAASLGERPAGYLKKIYLAAPFLIGSWFGQGQPDDKSEMWLIRQQANGNFQAQFRTCIKGKAQDDVESGHWSLAGDMETLMVLSVDGKPASQGESYKILSHDAGKQVYRYMASGFVYTSRRVGGDFDLPSCEAIS